MSVLVLDQQGLPLMPCTQKRARLLLARGRARVHRLVPFVISLVDVRVKDLPIAYLSLKIDPGSKTTGVALVRDVENVDSDTGEVSQGAVVLSLIEITHRGNQIKGERTAPTDAARAPRQLALPCPAFLNRGNKGKGWIAPSLQHRVDTTLARAGQAHRALGAGPRTRAGMVRFDMR